MLSRLLGPPHPVDPFAQRVTRVAGDENPRGEYVLYWAQAARRLRHNLGLEHAVARANALRLPVVVYEALRPDYPCANDRIHSFVLDGVAQNRLDAEARGLRYHFFLPRRREEARGVVRRLASRARLVVTDDYPTFVLRDQTRAFAARTPVALALVDGNGILPMRAMPKEQYAAKQFRDRAYRLVEQHWMHLRDAETRHFFDGELEVDGTLHPPSACDIDHSVAPVPLRGGRDAALARLDSFITDGLEGYATLRNRSPRHVSGLSPYLHFGHIGIHEIAERVLGSDAPADDIDSFLEEAVIRRELSFNLCFFNDRHESLAALPDWAKKTLDAHRGDRRKPLYGAAQLEAAQTHDQVWNFAQQQLLRTGTMHGYLRMLWGKKAIEWMATPEEAHAFLVEQHARYALDGRDPNTHAGVLWCFGKHDRPWAPQRPIFGMIRYMSSESTMKKLGSWLLARDS
ncbi:MAG: Deoxyribodipyrimidine photolyase [Acidobacteria bacterium]|nr:Deoxyribodipyrimidine photolyase [Acidobacteriota bacterium]